MPTLPGLDIPDQAQFDRVAATFPGATMVEKSAAYKDWLTNRIIERVQSAEAGAIGVQVQARQQELLDALAASLPAKRPEPELVYPQ